MSGINANVQKELDRLRTEFDEGVTEGYDASPAARADFCQRFYASHTARQRGYIFGHMLAEAEREREQQAKR